MKRITQFILCIVLAVSAYGQGVGGNSVPRTVSGISAALDLISSTQGTIFYRGASGWEALPPGTSGQLFSTQGAAANPIWVTATGGAGDVNGPTLGTATDNAIVRFDGTGGKTVQNSAVTIADTTGAMTWATGQAATLTGGDNGASLALGNTNTGASLGGGGLAVGSSASFVVGATAGVATNAVGVPQISASSDTYASIASIAHDDEVSNTGYVLVGKSRGSKASPTIVADTDVLGDFSFVGYDGAAYRTAASIRALISGAPGAADLPTRLAFLVVPDGSSTLTERMTITPTGNLLIGTTTDMSGSGGAKIAGTTPSTGVGTGALQVAGGIYAGAASVFGGAVSVSGTAATWTSGTGSPESVKTAPVGSLYTRTDGGASTTLYVKESGAGNTGWVAK